MHYTPYNNHCSTARLLIAVLCIKHNNLTYGLCLVHEKWFSIQDFLQKLYLHAGNRKTLQLHLPNQTFSTCVPVDRMLYASCLGCNYVLLGLCERLKHYQHCTNHHTLQLLLLFRNNVFYDTHFQSPTQLQIMEFSPDTVGRRRTDGIVKGVRERNGENIVHDDEKHPCKICKWEMYRIDDEKCHERQVEGK